MKTLKYIYTLSMAFILLFSCAEDDNDLSFIDKVVAPSEVSALFKVTQDNTGEVTITPNATGASNYNITFGDDTPEPVNVMQGESVSHTYKEGAYIVTLEAVGITGLTTEATQNLEVSFKAPENVDVTIANDLAVSKQVNVTANADFAISYDVYFGEPGIDDPVSGNIGEPISYTYQNAGTYTIRVIVMGAAIATTEYTEEFEVTEILQPLGSAPTPLSRDAGDVISIFSSAYSDVPGTNYFPDWGQGGQGSSWALFDLNGDEMLQYINLSYQGIALADGTSVDVSGMEYLHMDVWTSGDASRIETSLISLSNGEKPVWSDLTAGEWTSIEIPISDYTDQGLTVADIFQLKFVGDPWAAGTVFIDNIYFYKASSGPSVFPVDFETPFALSSFDGGDISIVANPDTNGNASSTVAKLVKGAGQVWAGSKITANNPYAIAENITVTANVWSPRSGLNLLMKFEDATPWPNTVATAEITATTTTANAWEELTFTITGVDGNVDYNNLVLIMDNGTGGDGSDNYTIYIDDISVASYLNFEPQHQLSSFDGGDLSVVANPDTNGNPSSMVGQLVKGAGQTWAGSKITVDTAFPVANGVVVKAKVWSPRAGLNLLMKFEDAQPWPNTVATAEITATTNTSNAWEELTFTLTGVDANVVYNNLVLIMDNGTAGDGSANYTIYIDDIDIN
ncbi:hypothetical protein [Seonamhaeicola maritimus]|uniref:PKD/Chitinase domain-containing protein n=1 Tax=Seonamhaeicola maritimus TaxID=2591822 RepID=A0A5C7GHN0_9FLAO|nr:hypothetical protein [Seonamhaeicola maritimus]TXG36993.1 hypothetical protein FUA22_10505 [Seonamhaeicola maritimus]